MSRHSPTLSDEELLALMKADDLAAFTALYHRYWKKLLAKAYARLHDYGDAEETVQDIFVRLWDRRRELELRFSFATYIQAALRYEILARAADAATVRHIPLEEADLKSLSQLRTSSQLFEAEELQAEINKAVDGLPEKCRLVFRLSRDEGLSSRQIGRELGIAEKTVEAHLTKALKTLRDALLRLDGWPRLNWPRYVFRGLMLPLV